MIWCWPSMLLMLRTPGVCREAQAASVSRSALRVADDNWGSIIGGRYCSAGSDMEEPPGDVMKQKNEPNVGKGGKRTRRYVVHMDEQFTFGKREEEAQAQIAEARSQRLGAGKPEAR